MTQPRRPTHTAFSVKDADGSKGRWTEIGAAWETQDQKGLILHLDCFPKDGRVVLRQSEGRQA